MDNYRDIYIPRTRRECNKAKRRIRILPKCIRKNINEELFDKSCDRLAEFIERKYENE